MSRRGWLAAVLGARPASGPMTGAGPGSQDGLAAAPADGTGADTWTGGGPGPGPGAAFARGLIATSVLLPLLGALLLAAAEVLSPAPWWGLAQAPGLGRAWALSAGLALVSTLGASLLALVLVAWAWERGAADGLGRVLAPLLAVPHVAVGMGLVWLLAPAGWLARWLAGPLGWPAPPEAPLLPDTLGLLLALLLKETPFLAWTALALLQRPDVAAALRSQRLLGRSLGVSGQRLWWTVLWPLWAPRLAWPVLAVLAYGLTVVDLPLVIGPTAPPPLAVWAWQALGDAAPERNAIGAAAAWLLAATLPPLALLLWALLRAGQAWARRCVVAGVPGDGAASPAALARRAPPGRWCPGAGSALAAGGLLLQAAVVLALAVGALAGPWPFPDRWPETWQWPAPAAEGGRLLFTAALAAAVAAAGLALAVAWLALTPATWDRPSAAVLMLPLLLPALVWVGGLYGLALRARLEATVLGLAWAHGLTAWPYALWVLAGPWRSLDGRLITQARLLGHGPWAVLWRVRLPLLRAPLAAAAAVAFAVSVAQFLPTQFIGAGRLTTVTTEAVTLAAAGQRGPASAQALLQALLPLLGFGLAAWVARTPWSAPAGRA